MPWNKKGSTEQEMAHVGKRTKLTIRYLYKKIYRTDCAISWPLLTFTFLHNTNQLGHYIEKSAESD